jgi:hypothetical protein
MIAPRLLAKQTVTKELRGMGCERIEQDEVLHHSYWKTQWGFHFYVPEIGPDGRCPAQIFHEILADVEASRPTKHK